MFEALCGEIDTSVGMHWAEDDYRAISGSDR
jgi:hypothetical protein